MVKTKEKIRLNLDISRDTRECLDVLQEETKLSSISDVVRRALALLTVVIENEKEGGKLVFRKKDGSEETLRLI